MVNLRVAFAIFFSGDVCLIGAIHLQASSEAEADSTGLRPVNWPALCARVKQADKLA